MQIQHKPSRRRPIFVAIVLVILFVLALAVGYWWWHGHTDLGTKFGLNQHKAAPQPPSFNKKQYSITDPTSIWVVVNKTHPLKPADYAPTDLVTPNVPLRLSASSPEMHLRQAAATALEQLFASAKTQGFDLKLSSGYRSYADQAQVYNGYVHAQGQASADAESARPGFSEHQAGLAADVGSVTGGCLVEQCFANTPSGKWLAANAYQFGFIVRYQSDKVSITGYEYEPWHIRYIGTTLSNEMHKDGITTLEEFFGLPPAPDYV
ncbi:MAG TPA: D-alanyl-D-alanine carboxypeptidase family protein [Candidatus Saccharimonadales bacterium]|jgi:D-alanyl-D-alanine carboxypeptidase|nr:D-alanyl-D-alanine carboxypeptidase family protein [Candidatus Saccharimonadales bacterium]